jgi:hypothetical protein
MNWLRIKSQRARRADTYPRACFEMVVLVALRPARRRAKRQSQEFPKASCSRYPLRPAARGTTCRSATSSTSSDLLTSMAFWKNALENFRLETGDQAHGLGNAGEGSQRQMTATGILDRTRR